MDKSIDRQRMAVWRAFQWANTVVMRNMERRLEAQGLPIAWFDVLVHLAEAPDGRLRMQVLADSVVLSRSGITRLIDRMERTGLVRREASTEDRRGAYAVITDQGQQALQHVWAVHQQDIEEYFTKLLTGAEMRSLYPILVKVIRANEGRHGAYGENARSA